MSKHLCFNLSSNEVSPGIKFPVSCLHVINEYALVNDKTCWSINQQMKNVVQQVSVKFYICNLLSVKLTVIDDLIAVPTSCQWHISG